MADTRPLRFRRFQSARVSRVELGTSLAHHRLSLDAIHSQPHAGLLLSALVLHKDLNIAPSLGGYLANPINPNKLRSEVTGAVTVVTV